jgi:hypothetical protein
MERTTNQTTKESRFFDFKQVCKVVFLLEKKPKNHKENTYLQITLK